jgi:hypothetical protein
MGVGINKGKIFESDILDSIPDCYFKYKLKDSPSAWNQLDNTEETNTRRFTPSNPCDIIAMGDKELYLLELKAHDGASLPVSPKYKEKLKKVKGQKEKVKVRELTHFGCIKKKQLDDMYRYEIQTNASAYFLINLYGKGKTYLVPVIDVHRAIYMELRKSLSLEWLDTYGIPIKQQRRVRSSNHYNYDLTYLFGLPF